MPEVPWKDPKYREKGSKGFIKNPDSLINETNYMNAEGDLHVAAAVIDKFYPNWRAEWIKSGKLKRGAMPKLKGLISAVENLPERRRKHDERALLIDVAVAEMNSDAAEALEGLKIMEREWKKLANLDKYGHKPAYKRNIELDQIERNAPKRPRPPQPEPPPQPPELPQLPGGERGGEAGGNNPVLTVNVSPEEGGRTTPRDGEVHGYTFGKSVVVQQRANKGYTFSHWELDGGRVDSDVLPLVMDMNYTVFAVFEKNPEPPPIGRA